MFKDGEKKSESALMSNSMEKAVTALRHVAARFRKYLPFSYEYLGNDDDVVVVSVMTLFADMR